MPKIKNIFYRIVLLLAGLLLGFIVAEIIAGVYSRSIKLEEKLKYIEEGYSRIEIGRYDDYLGWDYKPGVEKRVVTSDFDVTYSINSQGIRDKEISFDNPQQEFRIITLGESNIFGVGINYGQRLTEIIERALKNAEVINMGIEAFGMDQSFLQLQRDGFKYKPGLVILCIPVVSYPSQRCQHISWTCKPKPMFILNENKDDLILQDMNFVKNEYAQDIKSIQDKIKKIKKIAKKDNPLSITKKSKFFTLITYYLKRKEIEKKLKETDKVNRDLTDKKHAIIAKQLGRYPTDNLKRLSFLLLKKYRDICKEHGADFLVLVCTQEPKINYVISFCRELQIPCLNLTDILIKASKSRSLSFTVDPHYNSYAHRIIGEYTADYLKKKYNLEGNGKFSYQFLEKLQ